MMLPTPYYERDGVVIYHGDCREIVPLLEPWGVVLTDPPWGIHHSSGQIGRLKDVEIAGDADTTLFDWAVTTFGGGPAVIFGSWRSPPSSAKAAVVWDKGLGCGMGDLTFPWKPNFEMAYIFGSGWIGHRDTSVLFATMVSWATSGREHPSEKPVRLMRQFVQKSPPGTILDPFMGCGSTLRAAKDLGRKAVGIEIEEKYCEIAARRLSQGVLAL